MRSDAISKQDIASWSYQDLIDYTTFHLGRLIINGSTANVLASFSCEIAARWRHAQDKKKAE